MNVKKKVTLFKLHFYHPTLPVSLSLHNSSISLSLKIHVSSTISSLLFRQSIRIRYSNLQSSLNQMSFTTTSLGLESRKRKRRKLNNNEIDDNNPQITTTPWRSESNQRIYSSKLLDALRRTSKTTTTNNNSSDPRNIRAAADRVLAVTAKGRTRWSRAILKHHRRRLHLNSKILKKVSKKNPNDHKLVIGIGECSRRPEKVREVEKRVRVLGRLVPGCRKLSFQNLLEETTDYIGALEMQVRAMATLAQLLTNGSPSLTSGSS